MADRRTFSPFKSSVSDGGNMSLVGHLTELKKRLTKCIVVCVVALLACMSQSQMLTEKLLSISTGFSFIYISPSELLMVYLKISLIAGLVFALPVIMIESWQFVRPGLSKKESVAITVAMIAGLALFCVGVFFCYSLVLPISIRFLVGMGSESSVVGAISVDNYISFIMTMMLVFGAVFEMPIVILLLTSVGVVNPKFLRKQRKFVIVIIFFVAAVITPPDVTTQVLIALPMLGLFEISTILSSIVFRRKLQREAEEEMENAEMSCS